MIGFAMCGSYCTHSRSLAELQKLINDGYEVVPIISENVYSTDTRFGKSEDLVAKLFLMCGREAIHTIVDAEPLGPSVLLDALVICPCTGNTLAKIASGITDTSVTMAAKAHLRGDRPLIIALASNDAMSSNLANIGNLLNRKHIYFVPMCQDDPQKKPHSLVADFSLLRATFDFAMQGKQYRKLFI